MPDHRAARRGHHRLRLGLVRDAALPHRAAAGDGHPELGAHPDPARSPSATCCATSSAAPRMPADVSRAFDIGGPDVAHLPRHDAQVRGGRRAAAPAHPARAGAHPGPVQPLGRPGHPRARVDRPAARPSRCATRSSATSTTSPGTSPTRPGQPIGLRRGAVAWRCSGSGRPRSPPGGPPPRCPGAPSDPLPTDPDWAGGSLYTDERELTVDASPRGAVAGHRGHRRRQRLVLLPARLGGAGLAGPAGGRGRAAPRPPGRRSGCGSGTRWTSGGSRRSSRAGCCGCAPRCGCRAWPGWRCTRRPDERGPHPLPAARPVPPARAAGPRLLVERLAVPRRRLRRHGPQHRAGRGRRAPTAATPRRSDGRIRRRPCRKHPRPVRPVPGVTHHERLGRPVHLRPAAARPSAAARGAATAPTRWCRCSCGTRPSTAAGFAAPNRLAFLADCLRDLDAGLRERGGRLVVRSGDVVDEVCKVAAEADAGEVHMAARCQRLRAAPGGAAARGPGGARAGGCTSTTR